MPFSKYGMDPILSSPILGFQPLARRKFLPRSFTIFANSIKEYQKINVWTERGRRECLLYYEVRFESSKEKYVGTTYKHDIIFKSKRGLENNWKNQNWRLLFKNFILCLYLKRKPASIGNNDSPNPLKLCYNFEPLVRRIRLQTDIK